MARKSADRLNAAYDITFHGVQRTQSEAAARRFRRAKDKAAKAARKRNRN